MWATQPRSVGDASFSAFLPKAFDSAALLISLLVSTSAVELNVSAPKTSGWRRLVISSRTTFWQRR
ncbi:MAG: hypothetical protein ACK562_07670 [Acidobacteriota bacterium]